MERILILISLITTTCIIHCEGDGDTILSAILTPESSPLVRQERSYYDRYGYGRPYDRFDDRMVRCGRCDDDDDDDDYDRGRDRDDDRRSSRPSYGNKHDRNKYDDDDNRRYDNDRKNGNKNGTDDESDEKKHNDEKDSDRHHRRRNKHRNRYDDRDRYRPDYYDRFFRDPYRDRYYDELYRRPLHDRYPDRYDDYGKSDAYYSSYSGYQRPLYEDRYDRGNGYDAYGGYGPGIGRGPHDSFRPWDETYRGQAGWDAGGRGYYFASGRPDSTVWNQQQYSRPASSDGWQNLGWQNTGGYSGYSGYSGYKDPVYRGSSYGSGYQDLSVGQSIGWRNVGERRPYRDQSGVAQLDTKIKQEQDSRYGQNRVSYQPNTYQPGSYSQSTTPGTSYLFQREDELVTHPDTTAPPS